MAIKMAHCKFFTRLISFAEGYYFHAEDDEIFWSLALLDRVLQRQFLS